MNGKKAKYLRALVRQGLEDEGKVLPAKRHGVRKIKTTRGERYQLVVHPECVRYHVRALKTWVKGLSEQPIVPKPIKEVGFGSRRKRRGQAIRTSIPKWTEQGELIHNV